MADPTARRRRGRVPGPLPRGICPVCGNEYAVRANRTMGTHKLRNRSGNRFGYCTGIGKPPKTAGERSE